MGVKLMIEISQEAETIGGFYVDKKMKAVWIAELELLKKFIFVCEKYNLTYYMAGGSLLGAIRHNGFIPWDDDIDIDMPRDDYNKLIEIAKYEFDDKFFFQSTYTDRSYVRPHAQIRNSDTTAIVEHEKGLVFNQGIFIDIFPLDAAPKNKLKRLIHSYTLKLLSIIFKAGVMINPAKNPSKLKCLAHYIVQPIFRLFSYKKLFHSFENICSKYNYDKNLPIGEISFDYRSKCIWPRECFDGIVMKDFMGLKVACPKGYDTILKITFGDYMVPQKAPSYHGSIFFDVNVSYKTYLEK